MAFPSRKQVLKILKEIEEKEKRGEIVGSRMLPDDATVTDKLKYKVCRNILIIKKKYELSNTDIAEMLGTNRHNISRIINYHIDCFSFDKLMNYYHLLVENTETKKVQKALKKELDNFLEKDELKYG